MKTLNTSPISGMQELLPARQAIFDQLKNEIARVYHLHGFEAIETPVIDRTEVLLAKAGGDTEKQIYKVAKTTESFDEADQALRFDHTVPLARYVVEHESNLAFPFRATQIGRNFRGERAQKGRFREFYQCDMDIIGRNELPLAYDAEVILTFVDAAKAILTQKILVRVSNRKILTGLVSELGLKEKLPAISSIIDHAEKVAPAKTAQALIEEGLSEAQKAKIEQFMKISGPREEVVAKLRGLGVSDEVFNDGVDELDEVLGLVEKGLGTQSESMKRDDGEPMGGKKTDGQRAAEGGSERDYAVIADMGIIRGLDYYTGTVFETILPDYREIGSIGGGGRYENLAGYFTEQKFPGVGGSIGLTRLFYILSEYNLLNGAEFRPIDYALIPISANERAAALELAAKLRAKGYSTDVVLTDKRLGDKMAYAAKIATSAVVIGEDEVKSGAFEAKNLVTGEKTELRV